MQLVVCDQAAASPRRAREDKASVQRISNGGGGGG